MEHLLCECEYYSECLWNRLAEILTKYYNDTYTTYMPWVDLGQINIIYNIPHPFLLLYIPDKETRNAMLLLVQEIKRDIIYRRMNLPQSAQQVTHPHRLIAHLDSSIRRLHSYPQYIGTVKYCKPMEVLQRLREINLEWISIVNLNHAFAPNYHDNSTYPLPTLHKQTTLCKLSTLTEHTYIYIVGTIW
jgi:hypothetical protein